MATTEQYLTQLQADKQTLVNNLVTKGVEATNDETFTTLVPKVLDIQSGGSNIKIYNARSLFTNNARMEYVTEFCSMIDESCSLFRDMFYSASSLIEVPNNFSTSNGTSFNAMFRACSNLTTIPEMDCGKVTDISNMFLSCSKLTNLGGFKDLGKAYSTSYSAGSSSYTLNLSYSTLITHDSLMNVINGLYDIASKGCNAQKLVLGATNLAKLTAEEIAIATNKGWTVS